MVRTVPTRELRWLRRRRRCIRNTLTCALLRLRLFIRHEVNRHWSTCRSRFALYVDCAEGAAAWRRSRQMIHEKRHRARRFAAQYAHVAHAAITQASVECVRRRCAQVKLPLIALAGGWRQDRLHTGESVWMGSVAIKGLRGRTQYITYEYST